MTRMLATLSVLGLLVFCANSASAQMCDSRVSNPAEDPGKAAFTAARMWLQWLNQGQFTCALVGGDASHVRCTQGSTWYDTIIAGCAGSPVSCTAHHFDRNSTTVLRNISTYAPNSWTYNFQNGPSGYVSMSCIPDLNHLGNPCITTYGTCIQ